MNYQETVEYLFTSTPVFEKIGAKAYKPGLDTMYKMDFYITEKTKNILYIYMWEEAPKWPLPCLVTIYACFDLQH